MRKSDWDAIAWGCGCMIVISLGFCAFGMVINVYELAYEATKNDIGVPLPGKSATAIGLGVVALLLLLVVLGVKSAARARKQRQHLVNRAGYTDSEIQALSPNDFELWIRDVLLHKGIPARQVGGSGDFGADVIAGNHIKVAIQAKKYSKNVGNDSVAQVRQAMDVHRCIGGIVVTNSKFTKAAYVAAGSATPPIVLIDRELLHTIPAEVARLLRG